MHILHLISSPRGNQSRSRQLGMALVERLQATHPGSDVTTRDLATSPFPHLEEAHLAAFFTPDEQRTPAQQAAVRHSDEAIAELLAAEAIVIDAPMYNFNLPSTLKAWIDHIARAGITFRYTAQGPEGLVKNKQVYVAIASGGIYSEGPMKPYDFIEPYLRFMLGMLGMTDVKFFRVEGVNLPDRQDTALEHALASITVD